MTNKNKNRIFKDVKNFIFDTIKINKILLLIICILSFIIFLTGIIVAIKTNSNVINNDSWGIVDIATGKLTISFFSRLLSMIFVMIILFLCSFNKYLLPIAVLFIFYRSYLLGLNICLIIINYGFTGAIISVIIAFPCQLFILCSLILFYVMMLKINRDLKSWGGCYTTYPRLKVLLFSLLFLFILCIIETLLLVLFSADVILVI